MDFKVGQVLNFKYYDNIFGKLIRLGNLIHFGKSGATHSAIIYDVKKDTLTIAEALNGGFTISEYDRKWVEDKINEDIIELGTPKVQLKDVQKYCKQYEGTPYGWYDIFSITLYLLFGKKSFKINTNAKKIICSEAVCRILYDASNKKINFEEEFGIKYDLITPEHLSQSKYIKW